MRSAAVIVAVIVATAVILISPFYSWANGQAALPTEMADRIESIRKAV